MEGRGRAGEEAYHQAGQTRVVNVVLYIEIETSQLHLANRFKGRRETCLCRCLPFTGGIGIIPVRLGLGLLLRITNVNSCGEYEQF